jgi:hypothetical protein
MNAITVQGIHEAFLPQMRRLGEEADPRERAELLRTYGAALKSLAPQNGWKTTGSKAIAIVGTGAMWGAVGVGGGALAGLLVASIAELTSSAQDAPVDTFRIVCTGAAVGGGVFFFAGGGIMAWKCFAPNRT